MGRTESHFYEFGPFRLDVTERLLLRDGQHVPLTPKAFEALLALVENGGHVIDKDELIRKVWPDTFVEEINLARNIYSLRKVLGGEQYIETIPKRGYRFVMGVREVRVEKAAPPGPNGMTPGPVVAGESAEQDGVRAENGMNRLPGFTPTDPTSPGTDSIGRSILASRLSVPLACLVLGVALSVAVWFIALRPSAKAPVSLLRIIPVTSFPGTEDQGAFSPDGNQVAFVWDGDRGDNPDIYVRLIGAEPPLRLTTHPAPETDPAWSPDGRQIAFLRQSAENGGVFLVPSLGGPERKLADIFPYRPVVIGNTLCYSPDGKSLAAPDKHSQEDPFGIHLISIETGEKTRLTSPPAGSVGDFFPAFSPDQKTLAFVRSVSIATADIWLLPLTGGEPRRLTFDNISIRGLAWTPGGREIVFASRRGSSTYNLWKVSAGGGTPEQLMISERDAYSPAVSRQGNRLAYTQSLLDENIWRIGLNGSVAASEPPVKLISSTQDEDGPEYSPDGKKIVFVSRRSGSFEIWVCEADGSRPRQLTSIGGPLTGTPRWSPDGRQITFNSWLEGNADIYVISADGGKPRRLTNNPAEDVTPSWSRDGKWIYFSSTRGGSMQIWKIPAEGGEAVQVTRHGGFEGFESTDGKYFYYTKGRAVPGIWRAPVGGGEETPVLDHHRAGMWRYWAVTDKGIWFATAETPAHPLIEFYSFATGKVTQVATLDKPLLKTTPGLTVSPDGRWLLVAQMDQSGKDIMLVDNFR
ncbi:MAG TPA: winged helix-turn-helix domain-containing protein [Blastocatellia bacterium]|nr:winged helix-turn-helix domain-containing protein [Blastocatellia bacterium]